MKTVHVATERIEISVLILWIVNHLNIRFGNFFPTVDIPRLQPITVGGIRPYPSYRGIAGIHS